MMKDDAAEKYMENRLKEVGGSMTVADYCNSSELSTAFILGADWALNEVLAGIEREKNYHEFLEEKGEMRHPILACKEIASYVRALMGERLPDATLLEKEKK